MVTGEQQARLEEVWRVVLRGGGRGGGAGLRGASSGAQGGRGAQRSGRGGSWGVCELPGARNWSIKLRDRRIVADSGSRPRLARADGRVVALVGRQGRRRQERGDAWLMRRTGEQHGNGTVPSVDGGVRRRRGLTAPRPDELNGRSPFSWPPLTQKPIFDCTQRSKTLHKCSLDPKAKL